MRIWELSAEQQDKVGERWRRGESLRSIARRLGLGRRPAPRRAARSLTAAECEEISRGVAAGESARVVVRHLRRMTRYPRTSFRRRSVRKGRNPRPK